MRCLEISILFVELYFLTYSLSINKLYALCRNEYNVLRLFSECSLSILLVFSSIVDVRINEEIFDQLNEQTSNNCRVAVCVH